MPSDPDVHRLTRNIVCAEIIHLIALGSAFKILGRLTVFANFAEYKLRSFASRRTNWATRTSYLSEFVSGRQAEVEHFRRRRERRSLSLGDIQDRNSLRRSNLVSQIVSEADQFMAQLRAYTQNVTIQLSIIRSSFIQVCYSLLRLLPSIVCVILVCFLNLDPRQIYTTARRLPQWSC